MTEQLDHSGPSKRPALSRPRAETAQILGLVLPVGLVLAAYHGEWSYALAGLFVGLVGIVVAGLPLGRGRRR